MTKARDLSSLIGSSGQIDNTKITLDANEIPALDTAKITTGTFDASKIGSGTFADARISASSVSQHATSFDDNKIVNDISTLALRQASDANRSAYNTNSQFVDVFQDNTGIDTTTNASRDASEYVSSVTTSTESGGTEQSPNALSWADHPTYGLTYGSSVPDTIQTESSMSSYNWSAQSSAQITGNFWVRWHVSSLNTTASDAPDNNKIQFGITHPDATTSTGQSLYNNNITNLFMVSYRGNNATNIYVHKANTLQATIAKTLGTGHSLQLLGDGTDLKLYHSSSSNTWYDSGADLIHTFSNFTDSGADKRFLIGMGKDSFSPNDVMATNFSWKEGITSLGGIVTASATGNFTSTTITAPSSVSSMGAIITYQDNAGTNALNTDIVLELSADNGSNWSTATLSALPNFSTGIKMAKVNDLAVTAGTQLKYRLNFANQSQGSKEARIRGVALQY
jgi:Tfp pilus assembly protein PilV